MSAASLRQLPAAAVPAHRAESVPKHACRGAWLAVLAWTVMVAGSALWSTSGDARDFVAAPAATAQAVQGLSAQVSAGGILAAHGVAWVLGATVAGLFTRRVRYDASAFSSREQVDLLLDSTAEGICGVDAQGRCVLVNRALLRILGYDSAEELIGHEARTVLHCGAADTFDPPRSDGCGARAQRAVFRRKDGTPVPVEYSVVPVSRRGGVVGAMMTFADVSGQLRAESTIRHLAYFDTLTDLPNRRLFHDRLDQASAEARRSGARVALLYLDIDRFKTVNDTLGHESGDLLLKVVAERLRARVRAPDTVARLGGDEFAVVLGKIEGAEGAARVAKKIVAGVQRPIRIAGRELCVTVSVGIGLHPGDAPDTESLMRRADIAMCRAREMGGNGFQFYEDSMNAAALERLDIESGLRGALDRSELRLLYQPQVDLSNGRLIGVEALLRWMHPSRGVMLPEAFIPVAEDTGQIVAIGDWVLRTACRDLAAWRRDGHRDMRMAVNVSTRQFRQENLPAWVRGVLGDSGVPPDRLELEITETLLMDNSDEAACSLRALRQAGIGVSIDDFGTGYASLSYLKRFPIDVIKIDKSFVSGCTCNPDDRTIVDAVVALGRSLKLKVVAEGVEAVDQVSLLRSLHCDVGQGFYFGEPQSAARIAGMLAAGPLAGAPMAA